MPKKNNFSHAQLKEQQKRWNARANDWDSNIKKGDYYVNFEGGYDEFLKLEKTVLEKTKKLSVGIDIGCGTGVTSKLLSQYVEKLYILDIAEKMLEVAHRKCPDAITLCASATDIPLDDKVVDIAISRGVVVSHLPRDIYLGFFRELERIVRPNGIIIFDYMSNLDSAHFSIQSPKISFSKEEMSIILKGHGFHKIKFYGSDRNRVIRVTAIKI